MIQRILRTLFPEHLRKLLRRWTTFHVQGEQPHIFIFSTARSGSTWLFELLATQGRFKIVSEPFNLRKAWVRDSLGLSEWETLLRPEYREQMRNYLQAFIEGRDSDPRFRRETPFTDFWHFRTERIIFKILFAGEDDIDWYRREFGGHIIYLIRHPIPVTLSRQEFPRLQSLLAPPFASNFSQDQLCHARDILSSGDVFQIGILDWCLQNAVPLREARPEWLVLSYEQMVLEPDTVVRHLVSRYGFDAPEKMMRRIYKASRSTGKSSVESRAVLSSEDEIRQRRRWLIERWREKVDPAAERDAFTTLKVFGIDCYSEGNPTPASPYWISDVASSRTGVK